MSEVSTVLSDGKLELITEVQWFTKINIFPVFQKKKKKCLILIHAHHTAITVLAVVTYFIRESMGNIVCAID